MQCENPKTNGQWVTWFCYVRGGGFALWPSCCCAWVTPMISWVRPQNIPNNLFQRDSPTKNWQHCKANVEKLTQAYAQMPYSELFLVQPLAWLPCWTLMTSWIASNNCWRGRRCDAGLGRKPTCQLNAEILVVLVLKHCFDVWTQQPANI